MNLKYRIALGIVSSVGTIAVGCIYGRRTGRMENEWSDRYMLELSREFLREIACTPLAQNRVDEVVKRVRDRVPKPELSRELRFARRIFTVPEDWIDNFDIFRLGLMLLRRLEEAGYATRATRDYDSFKVPHGPWIVTDKGKEFLNQC